MQGPVLWAIYRIPWRKNERIEGALRDTAAVGTTKTASLQSDTLSGLEQPLIADIPNRLRTFSLLRTCLMQLEVNEITPSLGVIGGAMHQGVS